MRCLRGCWRGAGILRHIGLFWWGSRRGLRGGIIEVWGISQVPDSIRPSDGEYGDDEVRRTDGYAKGEVAAFDYGTKTAIECSTAMALAPYVIPAS